MTIINMFTLTVRGSGMFTLTVHAILTTKVDPRAVRVKISRCTETSFYIIEVRITFLNKPSVHDRFREVIDTV